MSTAELKAAILEARSVALIHSILHRFKDSGGRQEAAISVLNELRQTAASEAEDDLLLEAMDFVVGWCRADMRIWKDA